jgi:hypothetical protein
VSLRRLLAAALVLAGATAGLATQPAAAAAVPPSVVVAPDDAGIVRPGQDLGFEVTVTNTGTAALEAGRITTSLDPAPVASASTLLDTLAHPPATLLGQLTLAKGRVPALQAGDTATVRLTLTSDDISSIVTGANGARVLYAQYGSGSVQAIGESVLVRMAARSDATVGLSTVIPVLAPASTTGVVDIAAQQQLAGPDGAWSRALRAAQAAPESTIALDPAVLASIRLAGDAAPPEARAFLDGLGRLPNETVPLPYADADVTLERAAGLHSVLAPRSFAGVTVATADGTGPTPAPTASAASAADLTAWTWSDQQVAWPVPHTTSAADLAALGREGDAVLLPSDDLRDDTPARRRAGPLASIGSTRVLVADASTSSLLVAASADGAGGDAALATLAGVLATAAVTGETGAVLATVGRATDTTHLDRVLSVLGRQSWISMRSLGQVAAGDAQGVRLRAGSVPSARVATARSLVASEDSVQQLGKAIPADADADTVTAPQRLALLGMLSAAWRSDDTAWRTASSTADQGFRAVVGKVHLADQSAPNFVGSDGTFRAYVTNELPTPITVVIHAGASNGAVQFTGTASVPVTVPANSQGRGQLAFRTIRNGSTDLTLRLTTPDGTVIDELDSNGATVRAGFDTIVAVALLTALGLLLALGVYRNVKRRRRSRTATA